MALPLITLGRLPDGVTSPVQRGALDAAYYASFRDNQLGKNDREDANAADFAAGKLRLAPALAGSELVIAVVIPDLPQCSAAIGPVLCDKQTLTVTIDIWRSSEIVDRSKSFNARRAEMLYLPPLAAGNYRLQVQWREMTPADHGSGYVWSRFKVGEMPFDVKREPGVEEKSVAAMLPSDALRPMPMPGRADDARTQTPWPVTARRFVELGDAKEGVTVGSGNPFDFLRGDPAERQTAKAMPKLGPAKSDQSLYAMIVGPRMNSGEWASVESIQWLDRTATIDCVLWKDRGERTRNVLTYPLMIVQLIPPRAEPGLAPVTPAGRYQVNVVWHERLARESGEWYSEESQRRQEVSFEVVQKKN